jgi:P22 coat protein - gene protein 5
MANSLLTINMITREALRLWKNSNAFLSSLDSQYDDQYAKSGAKIGATLRIRLPNDYTVRTGVSMSVQDTTENNTTLTLATMKGVDVSFSSTDRLLSLDDFSKRVLAPMMNNLTGAVALDVMSGIEGGAANFTANTDGTGAVIPPTVTTWLNAGAILDATSAPKGDRKIIMDPFTQAKTVSSLAGLFNPSAKISEQYKTGQIGQALGFDWMMDQTVIKHTTAAYSGSLTVNGASQTGLTLVTNAITGGLNAGDIITIAGVNSVNRITKQDNGTLMQFVVTAAVATGGTSVSIYPAIVPPSGGQNVQYQTVTASPANSAVITVVTLASSIYRKNFAFVPEAVTMVTGDLELPKGVQEAAREQMDGVSMRMVSQYIIGTDQFATRLDVLYGYRWLRPEWVVAVGDSI